jgi:hypothetical protein
MSIQCHAKFQASLNPLVYSCRVLMQCPVVGNSADVAGARPEVHIGCERSSKTRETRSPITQEGAFIDALRCVVGQSADLPCQRCTPQCARVDSSCLVPKPTVAILSVQVILNHLYREGLFDVADTLSEEAGLPEDAAQDAKEKFSEMHRHLELVCHTLPASSCIGLSTCDVTLCTTHALSDGVSDMLPKNRNQGSL